ncbi:hypothetical protein [Microbulbifer sp. TYP-18]|uniref:hypothetical protein n=1 Tax=Microbulbifer sp. TYP-18 TaxID=3230024 RepID=UPI0034C66253
MQEENSAIGKLKVKQLEMAPGTINPPPAQIPTTHSGSNGWMSQPFITTQESKRNILFFIGQIKPPESHLPETGINDIYKSIIYE